MKKRQIAYCRNKSQIDAAINGHLSVYPWAEIEFRDKWAYFYKDGKEVWDCNQDYARAHFEIKDK